MKLSVVIPIYNLEGCMAQTVDSVLAQTYPNIEIIIVDDGSVDSSGVICDEYAAKYDSITVIHQTNRGLSEARNAGVKVATGSYVTFIDGDDEYGTVDTLEKSMQFVIDDPEIDFVQFPIFQFINNGEKRSKCGGVNQNILVEGEEAYLKSMFTSLITNNACNKIYRLDLFSKLRFRKDMVCEDAIFNVEVSSVIRKVFLTDSGFYKYNIRANSIMTSSPTVEFYHCFFLFKKLLFDKSKGYRSLHHLIIINASVFIFLYYKLPRKVFRVVAPSIKELLPGMDILIHASFTFKNLLRLISVIVMKIHMLTVKSR